MIELTYFDLVAITMYFWYTSKQPGISKFMPMCDFAGFT